MFIEDEAEGIAVGVRLPARTGDPIRHAIRAARKMQIAYQDGDRRSTERVTQPFAVANYVRSDVDLRLVRAAQRCPPFPRRPGGQRRCAE